MSHGPMNEHLSAERIQAFLDGEASGQEARAAEEHLASCARCREDAETWEHLFSELETLSELAPSAGFRERVLAGIEPAGVPVLERLRRLVARGRRVLSGASDRGGGHLEPGRLQDYVEGVLSGSRAARVETHLAACADCRAEEAGWRALLGRLEGLPTIQPGPDFADAVMARVRRERAVAPVPERAPGSALERALAWTREQAAGLQPVGQWALAAAGGLAPRSRRAWAAVGGIAAAPVVATVALVAWVVAHPLLSPGGVAAFVWWQTREGLGLLASRATGPLVESLAAFKAYSAVELLTSSPEVALAGAGAFSALTLLSLWILYRNLAPRGGMDGEHAHARI